MVLVSPRTVPAGNAWPRVARLVEGLIRETKGSAKLLKLSYLNSQGSKVTFQAGSLGF